MTNPHFTASGSPGTLSRGRSAPIRSELANIEAGFDSVETLKANVTSPTLLGVPKASTPAVSESELTRLATVGYVINYFGAALVTGLPSPIGHTGEILKTVDGISATWQPQYPTQTGNANKYLRTDGSEVEWFDPLPIGSIIAAYQAPDGYIEADGSVYLQADYPSLFSVIGHPPGYSTAATAISSLPVDLSLKGVSVSSDGVYAAAFSQATPYVVGFKREGDTFIAGDAVPSAAVCNAGAISPDGGHMAVAENGSPFVGIYKRSGDSWVRLANPATLPTGAANGVAWSPDGLFVAIAHTISPYVTVYSRAGDVFTKLSNPATLPAGIGRSSAFDVTGEFLAIGHDTTPFVTVYAKTGTGAGATLTKLADPATLPASAGLGAAWAGGSRLAVAHSTSPYATFYDRSGSGSGSTLTKTADPATLPAGGGLCAAGTADGEQFFIGHSTSPYLSVYQRVASAWVKMTDPSVLPGAAVAATGLGFGDKLLAVGVQSAVQSHLVYSPWNYDSSTEFSVPVVELGNSQLSERSAIELKTYIRAE